MLSKSIRQGTILVLFVFCGITLGAQVQWAIRVNGYSSQYDDKEYSAD